MAAAEAAAPASSHLTFDLGNLACFDPSPIDEQEARTNPDGCCQQIATEMTQALVERLFALPNKPSEAGRVAQLPPPSTPLPRAKPLPKPRAPTKWELFAQRKGITKQKRSKLAFDEGSGEWKRRYGYKRADDPDAVPILEAKPTDQVGEDPFSSQKADKAQRVKAQTKRQVTNLKAQAKAEGKQLPSLDASQDYAARKQKQAQQKRSASRMAGISTASLGKHDQRLPNEQPHERELTAKRRKFAPVTERGSGEAQRTGAVVDQIMRMRNTELVDVDRAAGRAEADARAQRHAEKQSQPSEGSKSSRGKGRGGRTARGSGRGRGKSVASGRVAKPASSGPGRPAAGRGRGRGQSAGKRGRR